MIRLRSPDPAWLAELRAQHAAAPLSYPEVGASLGFEAPAGYVATAHARDLPPGSFEAAKAALDRFAMFPPWVEVGGSSAEGETVSVVAHLGIVIVNLCRIVRRIDTPERYGFAYGTLGLHAERGEEIFCVERDGAAVRYRVFSFSRPARPLVWLGYPVARALQRRFVRASGAQMLAATAR